ncbi:MAG: HK97 family phage prohead protease [Candidatus Neomarinimicrobiota bacterium]
MEKKTYSLKLNSIKQSSEKENDFGIFTGLASTFEIDTEGDQIMPGTFDKALIRLKEKGKSHIQMKFLHNRDEIIGGFPVSKAFENKDGLFVEGQVNLNVQKGREVFSLLKQGVLTDMSIGFFLNSFREDTNENIRKVDDIDLGEISLVDMPANLGATIIEVKTVTPFLDLDLADTTRQWDSDEAVQRIRRFTDSQEKPSRSFRRAFMFFDGENADEFGSYKLPYADVIDGQLKTVPRALFDIRGVLAGARGGVDIPKDEIRRIKRNVNRYFKKMDIEEPFNLRSIDMSEITSLRDVNDVLKASGFSNKGANKLISIIKSGKNRDDFIIDEEKIIEKIEDIQLELKIDEITKKVRQK